MTEQPVLERSTLYRSFGEYVALDRRWQYLAVACALWLLAFWQLAGPVADFLSEAQRVRMPLPSSIAWVAAVPWWAIAAFGILAALAVGPRLRRFGNAALVAPPVAANVAIHLSLYFAQAAVVHVFLRNS